MGGALTTSVLRPGDLVELLDDDNVWKVAEVKRMETHTRPPLVWLSLQSSSHTTRQGDLLEDNKFPHGVADTVAMSLTDKRSMRRMAKIGTHTQGADLSAASSVGLAHHHTTESTVMGGRGGGSSQRRRSFGLRSFSRRNVSATTTVDAEQTGEEEEGGGNDAGVVGGSSDDNRQRGWRRRRGESRSRNINVGLEVMCRDCFQSRFDGYGEMYKWRPAAVVAIEGNNIEVQFEGWDSKYNARLCLDSESDLDRIVSHGVLPQAQARAGDPLLPGQRCFAPPGVILDREQTDADTKPDGETTGDEFGPQEGAQVDMKFLQTLTRGDEIECLDLWRKDGVVMSKWRAATVLDVGKRRNKAKITFNGWARKYDEWVRFADDGDRLRPSPGTPTRAGGGFSETVPIAPAAARGGSRGKELPHVAAQRAAYERTAQRTSADARDSGGGDSAGRASEDGKPSRQVFTAHRSYLDQRKAAAAASGRSDRNDDSKGDDGAGLEPSPPPPKQCSPSRGRGHGRGGGDSDAAQRQRLIRAFQESQRMRGHDGGGQGVAHGDDGCKEVKSDEREQVVEKLERPNWRQQPNSEENSRRLQSQRPPLPQNRLPPPGSRPHTRPDEAGDRTGDGDEGNEHEAEGGEEQQQGNRRRGFAHQGQQYAAGIGGCGISRGQQQLHNMNSQRQRRLGMHREEIFVQRMATQGLDVRHVGADGNCLFRAVADQCYGDEGRHMALRAKCVNHLAGNARRFRVFIDTDVHKNFKQYLRQMSCACIWGDDLEIRALEEIFDRPIAIYSVDSVDDSGGEIAPLNTHFDDLPPSLAGVTPIKISYHGQCHYNSVHDERCVIPLRGRGTSCILDHRVEMEGDNGDELKNDDANSGDDDEEETEDEGDGIGGEIVSSRATWRGMRGRGAGSRRHSRSFKFLQRQKHGQQRATG